MSPHPAGEAHDSSDQRGADGVILALRTRAEPGGAHVERAVERAARHLGLAGGMRFASIVGARHDRDLHGFADDVEAGATFEPGVLAAHWHEAAGEGGSLWIEFGGRRVDLGRVAHVVAASLRDEVPPAAAGLDGGAPVEPGRLAGALARLRGIPGRLHLPETITPSPLADRRWRRSRPLPVDVARACASSGALLLGMAGLLHRYAGVLAPGEIVIAVTRSPWLGGLVQVVRVDLSGDATVAELGARVTRAAAEAADWDDVGFEALASAVREERGAALTEAAICHHDPVPLAGGWALDTGLSRLRRPPLPDVKIALEVLRGGDAPRVVLGHDEALFEAGTVDRMTELLGEILARTGRGGLRLRGFTALPPGERARILGASRGSSIAEAGAPGLLHRPFEEQAAARPHATAFVHGDASITYAELDRRANRVAHVLRDGGIGPDVPVGVLMERSADFGACMLGIMKAGGACLLLDPTQPDERLQAIVAEARPRAVLSDPALLTRAGAIAEGVPVSGPQISPGHFAGASDRALPCPARPDHVAIILYTSGSLGTPKGVMMCHGGRLARQRWTQSRYPLGPEERHLFKSPIGFGTMVRELLWPLHTGATSVVARSGGHRDGAYLVDLVVAENVTIANFAPSMLRAFASEADVDRCRGLRHIFCTGEAFPIDLQELIAERLPHVALHTFYGSTEYPTCTAWDYRPDERRRFVTVGRRTDAEVYLLGPDGEPVPQGAPGEAHVGGPGLARGYLARPDLTAERFLDHPFHDGAPPQTEPQAFATGAGEAGARLFRIGDVLRENTDGQLQYLGRLDRQVKIRGCRVEVDEVAAALRRHPAVEDAVVVSVTTGHDGPRLAAYYVARRGAAAPDAPGEDDLLTYLRARVPEYMVPAALMTVAAFPTIPNGEVDRRALPPPSWTRSTRPYEPPEGPVEEALAAMWSELLDVPRIGRGDLFLQVGGHSLSAVRVLSRVRARWGVKLSVDRFLERSTIAALAEEIAALVSARADEGERADAAHAAGELPPLAGAVEAALVTDDDVQALVRALEESGIGPPRAESARGPLARRFALAGYLRAAPASLDVAPLSPAQRRLWYYDRLHPLRASYNLGSAHRLVGPLDADALGRALRAIVRRHDALRMCFFAIDGQPAQAALPDPPFGLSVDDLRRLAPAERATEARAIAAGEARAPFDLSAPPLLRARLVRLDDEEHQLLLHVHHIAGDGWSRLLLERQLGALYAAHLGGRAPAEAPAEGGYARFARSRDQELRSEATAREVEWWSKRLRGAPPTVALPGERSGGNGRAEWSYEAAGRTSRAIPPDRAARLRALSRARDATLFMTLRAAFALLVSRLTGSRDLVLGSPIGGRERIEHEEVLGCFVNMVAIRTEISVDDTFQSLLERVRRDAIEAFRHADVPFELLVEKLRPERSAERHPIFDVSFNVLSLERGGLTLEGVDVEELETAEPNARFDLNVSVVERGKALEVRAVHRRRSFSDTRMAAFVDQYVALLDQIAADPGRRIDAYSLVTEATRPLLHDARAPLPAPSLPTAVDAFLACAARHPEAPALRGPGVALDYGSLADATARLAAHLRRRGVRPGDRVALLGSRSPGLVIAMLAIWRARGVVVALDPDLPPARRRLVVERAAAAAAIVVGVPAEELQGGVPVVAAPSPDGSLGDLPAADPTVDLALPSISDPAYVVFTSGSTGLPKGILGVHLGLAHLLAWERETFGIGAGDRVPMLGALSFDPVLRDVLLPLTSGGVLCVPPPGMAAGSPELLAWVDDEGVTLLHTIPTLLRAWQGDPPPDRALVALRWVLVAGEPLHADLVERWRRTFPSSGEIVNLYGPTETTMIKSAYVVPDPPQEGIQPVGWALPDTQILVRGHGHQPCGVGELGEIYIRTPCRTLGYLGAPEQARAFAANPDRDDPEDLLYRTGDRGRYRPDGSVEVEGRVDAQIKIRGVRVEPEEVEAVLAKHPGVARAAVAAPRDPAGERRLAAWIVPAQDPPPAVEELARFARRHLPAAMVPSTWAVAEVLPLTPNGKLDRAALERVIAKAPTLTLHEAGPEGPVEEALAAIWRDVLGVDRVARDDDFFAIGGHSLLAIRMMSRVRRAFACNLPLGSLFPQATIASLARRIERGADASAWTPIVPLKVRGSRPPLFCVHPAGGSVLGYRDLAGRLSLEQPVHGIQGPDPLAPAPLSFARIEEMADHYVDALLDVCPEPPYLLAGHSFGGMVAYEMAQRLVAAGREVALLALLDTGAPRHAGQHGADGLIQDFAWLLEKHDLDDDSPNAAKEGELWEDLKELAIKHIARQHGIDPAELGAKRRDRRSRRIMSGRERLASIQQFFQAYRLLPSAEDVGGYAELLKHIRVFRANFRAARRYAPRPSAVPLTYFRASENVSELATSAVTATRAEGWAELSPRGIRVLTVPSHHLNLLAAPAVDRLAADLDQAIEEALAQRGDAGGDGLREDIDEAPRRRPDSGDTSRETRRDRC